MPGGTGRDRLLAGTAIRRRNEHAFKLCRLRAARKRGRDFRAATTLVTFRAPRQIERKGAVEFSTAPSVTPARRHSVVSLPQERTRQAFAIGVDDNG